MGSTYSSFGAYLWPEELHKADPAVHTDIHNGFQALRSDSSHDQRRPSQIEVIGSSKVSSLGGCDCRAFEGCHDVVATHAGLTHTHSHYHLRGLDASAIETTVQRHGVIVDL